jgi:hypothetical protein
LARWLVKYKGRCKYCGKYDAENLLMINILKTFKHIECLLREDSILSKEYLFGRKAVVDCFIYSNSAN